MPVATTTDGVHIYYETQNPPGELGPFEVLLLLAGTKLSLAASIATLHLCLTTQLSLLHMGINYFMKKFLSSYYITYSIAVPFILIL